MAVINPTVAILFSVYGGDSLTYLKQAIDSINQQDYLGLIDTIFCVDGVISDDMMAVCKATKNAIVLQLSNNQGLASNLNNGLAYIKKKKYEFIARMDADDISDSKRIRLQVEFLMQQSAVMVVGASAKIIDGNGAVIGLKKVPYEVSFSCLRYKNPIIHSSIMFKMAFLEFIGGYNATYKKNQDYYMWLRSCRSNIPIFNLQQPLVLFRYDSNIIQRRKKAQKNIIQLKSEFFSGWRRFLYCLPNFIILCMPSPLIFLAVQLSKRKKEL